MTDKTDYKAALNVLSQYKNDGWWCPECGETDCAFNGSCVECGLHIETVEIDKHRKTIQEALEIADRVQSGRVSEDVLIAGAESRKSQFENFGIVNSKIIFKAMTAQLLKEVRDAS